MRVVYLGRTAAQHVLTYSRAFATRRAAKARALAPYDQHSPTGT